MAVKEEVKPSSYKVKTHLHSPVHSKWLKNKNSFQKELKAVNNHKEAFSSLLIKNAN